MLRNYALCLRLWVTKQGLFAITLHWHALLANMSAVVSVISYCLRYLSGVQPKEPWQHPQATDSKSLEECRALLDDPDYIRHDPHNAFLAQQHFRELDQLPDIWDSLEEKDRELLHAFDNKFAELTVKIIECGAVSRCSPPSSLTKQRQSY